MDRAIKSLLFYVLPFVSFVCLAELQTQSFIVELEQSPGSPGQNFSIKPGPDTLASMQTIDREPLPGKSAEITGTNGYPGPDTPPDDKPYRPGGFWVSLTTVVESVSWELLYVANDVAGYKLLLSLQEDSLSPQPFSWMPVVSAVIVGWLSRSDWNPEAPLFNQLDEQVIHASHELRIITLPLPEHEASGTTHKTTGTRITGNGLTRQKPSGGFNFRSVATWFSGGAGGDQPHEPWHSRSETDHCPTCNGICELRPRINQPGSRNTQGQFLITRCQPNPDASITCSANICQQTGCQKSSPHSLNMPPDEIQATGVEADSATCQSLTPSAKKRRTVLIKYLCGHQGCNRLFKTRASLSTHKNQYHSGPKNCQEMVDGKPCDRVCDNAIALWNHKIKDHSGPQTCREMVDGKPCSKVCDNAKALSDHKRRDHSGPQTCQEMVDGKPCGRVCDNARTLSVHKRRDHSGPQACQVMVDGKPCGKGCDNAQALSTHKTQYHSGPKTCQEMVDGKPCSKVFDNAKALSVHKRRDHGGPQTCREMVDGKPCNKVYDNVQTLSVHKSRYHSGPQTCREMVDGKPCGRVCDNAQALSDHKRRDHSGPQTCQEMVDGKPCGRVCNNAHALSNHKRIHRKRKRKGVGQDD